MATMGVLLHWTSSVRHVQTGTRVTRKGTTDGTGYVWRIRGKYIGAMGEELDEIQELPKTRGIRAVREAVRFYGARASDKWEVYYDDQW